MLDDKYRIERLLATGGMGAVYVGTHTRLRKRVAIKILSPQHSSAPGIERFRREAITASQIGHEGIAQVTDLGTSSEGEPFLVMEYLEGESLASRLRTCGPLGVEDACEIGCAILSPLGAAHRAGIVHRDLKPDNVYLVRQSRGETVKLLDFGISRVSGVEPEFRLTLTGLVLGTPFYMSPEQARGESEITTAADIYAFGVILYEMLVGEVPILADNYNQLMYRVTTSDFQAPSQRRPTLPGGLEQIILHAMALAPRDRPASTAELEQALLPFCRAAFREHPTGRLSAPALSPSASLPAQLWSSAHANGGVISDRFDHALFEGSTIPDTHTSDVHPPDDTSPVVEALGMDGVDGAPAPRASRPLAARFDTDGEPVPTTAVPRRSRAPRLRIALALAVAAGVVIGVLTFAIRLGGEPSAPAAPLVATAPVPPAAAPPASTASPPAEPAAVPTAGPAGTTAVSAPPDPAASRSATITLRLAIDPPAAAVTLDGARVTGTEIAVARDGASHQLRITAPGYQEYDEAIRFDESQRLVVQLKPAPGPVRGKDRRPERAERPERTERAERIESRSPYE
jgi:eukaryotic-like serine/threonine-protein kinase